MRIFDSFDDREKEIENAAGNAAFKVFWILMLFSIYIIFRFYGLSFSREELCKAVIILILIIMFAALCVKYYHCWINKVNRKTIILKFFTTLIGSAIFILAAFIIHDAID
ncbi:hypothetical protein ACFL6L_01745 [candidate division KSB1 bacterium]